MCEDSLVSAFSTSTILDILSYAFNKNKMFQIFIVCLLFLTTSVHNAKYIIVE